MTTILDAIADEKLFKPWFRRSATWTAWRSLLAAMFALPMTPDQLATYTECTGRTAPPTAPAKEAWLICGRRAGKSFTLALIAVFLACFHDYRRYLAPGERGVVFILAVDRGQARVIFRYIRAMLLGVPMLRQMVERETANAFDLSSAVSIEVQTSSYKSTRGYCIVAALCDELAFWPQDDASEPDYAVLDALRPGMATIPNAMLLCASSPYARKGALHDAFKQHYGKDGDVLVWKAPTRVMNPTVPQATIDAAMQRDPADAMAEWMAEFRSDLESFISREAVLACVDAGVRERPPVAGQRYWSFVDPSGGSNDSMTCAIGHQEGSVVVVDAVREIFAPFDPESATVEFVRLFRTYGITRTHGDRYAAAWCAQAFEKKRIEYRHAEAPRSTLYLNLLPHLNSNTIKLLDIPRAINQIANLERRTGRGARDTIDHPRGQHDDVANALAGLAYVITNRREGSPPAFACWGGVARTLEEISALGGVRRNKVDPANPNPQSQPCLIDFRKLEKPAVEGITRRPIGTPRIW